MVAISLGLFACNSPEGELRTFETPEPDLGFQAMYVARLAIEGQCVTLLLGEGLVADDQSALSADEKVVPLFGPGFSFEGRGEDFVLTTPSGETLRPGDVVTGEGGIYPDRTEPRSAPILSPPDISECGSIPFQVNSMQSSTL